MTTESSSTSPSNEAPLQGLDLSQLGPGRRLRDARKVMNLDQADIAANLNLALSVVNALERDDYDDMPPPVFVRGYLRAYAVLVSQPEDEICAMYDALIGNDAEDDPFRPVTLQDEDVPGDNSVIVKVAASVVVVVFLAGVAAWFLAPEWFGKGNKTTGSEEESVAIVSPETKLAVPDVATAEKNQTVMSVQEPERQNVGKGNQPDSVATVVPANPAEWSQPQPANRSTAPDPEVPAKDQTPSVAVVQASAAVSVPVQSEVASVDAVVDEARPETLAVTPEVETSLEGNADSRAQALVAQSDRASEQAFIEERAEEVSAPTVASDKATLSLSFSDSCWTSISDANGKRLVYGVMKAGVDREVSGTLPFKVILGQTDAVKVRLNGELFNHERFSRGKIARFTIGEDAT